MANKAANIDFGQSINRMNRMTSEKPLTEQSKEGRVEARNEERPTEPQRPLPVKPQVENSSSAADERSHSATTTNAPADERRGPGRKKRENNIRTNPKTIFFDDSTDYALSTIKLNNSIDKKDLVLAATRLFLEKYYQSDLGRLTDDGVVAIFQQLSGNK